MAGTSLLALIDDIATLLDDVALMTKVAAKKTSGVIGDDLALNAEQVSGIRAEREIPVVLAVAKGSFINKVILVPLAILISAIAPWAITPLLMLGGSYLCFEGFEKIMHSLFHKEAHHPEDSLPILTDPTIDLVAFEKDKIKGAVRTDFILSGEIIVIVLGTVATESLLNQSIVVATIAFGITVVVYGIVAAIVKLDDLGLYLLKSEGIKKSIGGVILKSAPLLMKTLSIVGTAAMFLVGGEILLHGIPHSHDAIVAIEHYVENINYVGQGLSAFTPSLLSALFGLSAGALLIGIFNTGRLIFPKSNQK